MVGKTLAETWLEQRLNQSKETRVGLLKLELWPAFSQRASCTLVPVFMAARSLLFFMIFHNRGKLFELLIWPSNDCWLKYSELVSG